MSWAQYAFHGLDVHVPSPYYPCCVDGVVLQDSSPSFRLCHCSLPLEGDPGPSPSMRRKRCQFHLINTSTVVPQHGWLDVWRRLTDSTKREVHVLVLRLLFPSGSL